MEKIERCRRLAEQNRHTIQHNRAVINDLMADVEKTYAREEAATRDSPAREQALRGGA